MQRTFSLPIHVNCLLLINEINEIARETQCFTLPLDLILPNKIIEKEIVKARTRDFRIASNARSPLDQAGIVYHHNHIEYYNMVYCLNKRARSQTTFTDCIYES